MTAPGKAVLADNSQSSRRVTDDPGTMGSSYWPKYWHYGLAALAVLFFVLIRFHLRDMPLERDEGEYAYAGQLLLQRIPPYLLAYNMKLPGTYAAYAVIMAVFGQSPGGIHLGLVLVNAASMILVFLLALRLFGKLAGVVACAAYGLLSTSEAVLGFAAHATHFVVLAALGGILLLLRAAERKKLWLYFGSGFLLGLAFLMKQPGIFFVLFGGLYLLKSESGKAVKWRELAAKIGTFSLGTVVPFGLTCLLLWRAGVLRNFFFWTFAYASQYATSNGVLQAWPVLRLVGPGVLGDSVFLWIIGGVGMAACLWHSEGRQHAWFALVFLLFSFLAVCPGFYFRGHYFILMLPAVALLAGLAVSATSDKLGTLPETRRLAFVPILLFVAACAYSVIGQRNFFFEMDPVTACRSVYAPNPFPEAVTIADYIKSHSQENARIAVLGSEPEIYFYAKRHSATGYIYTYEFMEEQKFAASMQKDMIHQIEGSQPEYVVYVNSFFSWFTRPKSDTTIFAWAKTYLHDYYDVVGIVDIGPVTEYQWGDAARTYRPRFPNFVEVFKRKTS